MKNPMLTSMPPVYSQAGPELDPSPLPDLAREQVATLSAVVEQLQRDSEEARDRDRASRRREVLMLLIATITLAVATATFIAEIAMRI